MVEALASAAAFAVPGLPRAAPLAVGLAALAGAVLFTIEYPKRVRGRAVAAQQPASSPAAVPH